MASLTIERNLPPAPLRAEIELDPAAHAAQFAGRCVALSRREFALLELLVANVGEALSRERIAAEVWGGDRATNVVDVYINYLRRKLGDGNVIRTVRGVGYTWGAGVPAGQVSTDTWKIVRRQSVVTERPPVVSLPGMIGDSPAMQRVYRMARIVAPRTAPVLITGATGTGKELVARAIHDLSSRASRPMITINCAAIPESLLEAELFGHTRGAFTGAVQSRLGRIHAAHGGTLFLDEIGELALPLQAKLLRFLEAGELQRLGSPDVFRIDVRVIAASNADLLRKIRAGTFRDDLYYRLAVFPIALPSLKDRASDIVLLARHFLAMCDPAMRLSPAAEASLRRRTWPGNVRELRHAIERAAILANPKELLETEHVLESP